VVSQRILRGTPNSLSRGAGSGWPARMEESPALLLLPRRDVTLRR